MQPLPGDGLEECESPEAKQPAAKRGRAAVAPLQGQAFDEALICASQVPAPAAASVS